MSAVEKWLWNEAESRLEIRAGFICEAPSDNIREAVVISSFGIPYEPFNGAENCSLIDALVAASTVPQTHEHSIKNLALSNILPRFGVKGGCCSVMWFSKVVVNNFTQFFLAFPNDNKRAPERTAIVEGIAHTFVDYFYAKRRAAELSSRLHVIERYTKEIGHDLANATQAMLAKLRVIGSLDLAPEAMKRKAEESVKELKQVYGIADGLGLALEQEYTARSLRVFDIQQMVKDTAEHLEQEAAERGLKIEVPDNCKYSLRGDKPAMQLAIQHILGNAIKYSNSDRIITVRFRNEVDQFVISIENQGIGLPKGFDEKKIYDFGFRSPVAKSMHVNGSGIGLYTAKKIILAHGGRLWHQNLKEVTIFNIGLPVERK
jgi:signal transduction histidine kinase